jgi:hypothetical protein
MIFLLACQRAHRVTNTRIEASLGKSLSTANHLRACGSCRLAIKSPISSDANAHTLLAWRQSNKECLHESCSPQTTHLLSAVVTHAHYKAHGPSRDTTWLLVTLASLQALAHHGFRLSLAPVINFCSCLF